MKEVTLQSRSMVKTPSAMLSSIAERSVASSSESSPTAVARRRLAWTASRLAALPKGERPATPSFGIEQIAEFRNVVYSLREAFDFVIIDLPSMREPAIPMLLTHQMDGLLVVVDSTKTKREEVEIMFQRVHHQQLLGFVFNRVNSESLQ